MWALHARAKRPHFPPGVYRHRSVEEMNALQEQWDEVNFEAYRRRIEGTGGGDHGLTALERSTAGLPED